MIKNKDVKSQKFWLVDYEIIEEEGEFFLDYYKDTINEILKDYGAFLVVAYNGTWNNSTGYKITSDKIDAFSRNYDFSQELISVSRGNKSCELREYHHDKPLGHKVKIIGLTEKERNFLELATFENILKFAEKH